MSVEQFVAVIGALVALCGALSALAVQVAAFRHQVDGRMTELLNLTRSAALAEGVKITADAAASASPAPPSKSR